jgi:hypothetical protein
MAAVALYRERADGDSLYVMTRIGKKFWEILGHNYMDLSKMPSIQLFNNETSLLVCAALWIHV